METDVLIIGGGATGTGIARDLSLRGINCILVEQNDLNAGATGANHGLLHSGARYVAKDPEAARECHDEGEILKKYAPQCVEDTGGIFVAVKGDNEEYIADFPSMCERANVPFKEISVEEAIEKEPTLSKDIIAAFEVQDATIDPFRLSIDNISDARNNGAGLLRFSKVTKFIKENGKIKAARVVNSKTGEVLDIEASQFVNASGAWADIVAQMAGAKISMLYSKGSLLVTSSRMNHRVINRLRQAGDADILVPGGTVSIIGTTSIEIDNLDDIRPTPEEVDQIIKEGTCMVPELESTRYIRAYAGVRPLVWAKGQGGRSISRNYTLLGHEEDGLENFITITGGKLTTYRLMAEKTCDLIASRLKVDVPCKTHNTILNPSHEGEWTEPGRSSKDWLTAEGPKETLLCECEMVTTSMVDNIVSDIRAEGKIPTLKEIGLRSRVGKGPCQGAFCSFRVASHLYNQGVFTDDNGISEIRDFINERWKGFKPLIREKELVQTDLQEAFLCGLFGIEN
jgi:glycerol-3-phosphate dehydrogenase